MDKIATLAIRRTKNLLTPDTRIAALVYAKAKYGKTTFASGLDALTKKYRNKPTLIIASEIAEGGGTMTLNGQDIEYVMPSNWNEMEALIASLTTNDYYGGIVLDNATDYVARIVKPHALSFPTKEKAFIGPRPMGVPVRSDYQVMGEFTRSQLNRLVNLTNENTPEKYRKDLIVTALERERTDEDGNRIAITPDLPGALSETVTAMFQSVMSIVVRQRVVNGTKISGRELHVSEDGMRVTGDRTSIFPHGFRLTSDDGKPQGIMKIYDEWRSKLSAS